MRTTRTEGDGTSPAIAREASIGLIGAAAMFAAGSAFAQSVWIDRDEVVAKLGSDYAEQPRSMGVADNGGVIELFTAPDGATWTMILTMPDGTSRLITAGESWVEKPIRPAGSGS